MNYFNLTLITLKRTSNKLSTHRLVTKRIPILSASFLYGNIES
jgi:hypothetical protein